MAYRNGTYIAFHADGNNLPGKTDIDYYNLIKAWSARGDDEFTVINSHDKSAAVRDSSLHATLRRSLHDRLSNSKNMLLIIGETTRFDNDWVPFEIEQAIDRYKIPIIATYTSSEQPIRDARFLSNYWPEALDLRIKNGSAHVIHIPFKKPVINAAINQFSHNTLPKGEGLGVYSDDAYHHLGFEI